jgi:hypothetical protein
MDKHLVKILELDFREMLILEIVIFSPQLGLKSMEFHLALVMVAIAI